MTWNVQKIIEWSQNYLKEKGVENPRLDVELLLEKVTGLARVQLYMQWDRPLTADELEIFKSLLKRRVAREPLAYILGRREFYSLSFAVSPGVLIPRPETEELVEHALNFLKAKSHPEKKLKLLDLYTGSGCILSTLLKYLPSAEGIGVDCSIEALKIAQTNAATHQVIARAQWLEADLTEIWPAEILNSKFDLITANPPYIAEAEWTSLQAEIQYFEPKIALISGPNGMECYEIIFKNLPQILTPHGIFLAEIGETQAAELKLMAQTQLPLANIEILEDLSKKERFLKIKL